MNHAASNPHEARGVDSPSSRPGRRPTPAAGAGGSGGDGEDVIVAGEPFEMGPEEEGTRRRVAIAIIIGYTVVLLAGLVATAFGQLDAATVIVVLVPYGGFLGAVLTHYFWRGRR